MGSEFSVAGHYQGGVDEALLKAWVEQLRSTLKAPAVSLGLLFLHPRFFANAPQILEILRVHGRIPLLAGCSSSALIAGDKEVEEDAGLALGLYYLPGAELQTFTFGQENLEEATGPGYW